MLVSYDDMFSAVETAYFVDRAGVVRDRLTLGRAHDQGLITELAVAGPDSITFAFPMQQRRRLRVHRRNRVLGLGQRWLSLESVAS